MRERLRGTVIHRLYAMILDARVELRWRKAGRPIPPPAHVKRRALRRAAKKHRLRIFIETGTFQGDTIAALRSSFDRLYTIELFEPLYEAATARFAGDPKIEVLQGNSADVLPTILDNLDQPALIWLDAHNSGPGTAAAAVDPPQAELEAIFARAEQHVVYIDDACSFEGAPGYPTVAEIRDMVSAHRAGWTCSVVDDVIRVQP